MSKSSFIFQGRIYPAKVGEVLTVKGGITLPGDEIKLTTTDFVIFAEKINTADHGDTLLKVKEILTLEQYKNYSKQPTKEPSYESSKIQVVPNPQNLTKYTKAQLVDLANELGVVLPTGKITKKEIIELINNR